MRYLLLSIAASLYLLVSDVSGSSGEKHITGVKPVPPVIVVDGSSGGEHITPPPATSATPRLEPGPHIDFIVGFDALNPKQAARANSLFAEAVTAGRRTTRVQLDWSVLEPQPGVYDTAELKEALDFASQSRQSVFVTVTTLDTGELTMPADLVAADGRTAAAGLTLDGPEITRRFRRFLDWLVPEIAAYKVWGLSLANEPSTNSGTISEQEIVDFLTQSADYAKTLDTDLAITVTLASATDPAQRSFSDAVMKHLDIAMFNYYCLDFDGLQATDQARWASDLDVMISAAGGRDIFFQELGCPVGYSDLGGTKSPPPEAIGATPRIQQAFFQYMMDQLVARDQLRGASIFQLFDWSPKLSRAFTQFLIDPREDGSQATAAALQEWMMTVGMCRWPDGVCREAWNVYLDGVARAANVRATLAE